MPLESSRFRTKLYQLTNHLQNIFSLKNVKWAIWCLIALSLIIIDSKLILEDRAITLNQISNKYLYSHI